MPVQAGVVRAQALCRQARVLRDESERLSAELLGRLSRSKRLAHADESRFSLRLARLRPAVSYARLELRQWLERLELEPDDVHSITLACSEAVANAIEHPVAPERELVELTGAARRDTVTVTVRDYGRWAASHEDDERGRGLEIARLLMDRVEVARGGTGTSVRMWKRVARAQRSRPSIATST